MTVKGVEDGSKEGQDLVDLGVLVLPRAPSLEGLVKGTGRLLELLAL